MLEKLLNKKYILLPLLLTTVVLFSVIYSTLNSKIEFPELVRAVVVNPPVTVKVVSLVDHSNNNVNIERFKKHWTFVFFGFTNCPDVCPATISQLKLIKKGINENTEHGRSTQFFFVSVDPERDTVEYLSKYMAYFDSSFVGLTGNKESILDFEKQLGAFHRIGSKKSNGDYDVQHSAEIFLIDSDAMLVAKFQPPMDTKKIVRQFSEFVLLKNATLS